MKRILIIALLLVGIKAASQDTTFFDSKWVEIDKEYAKYYRVISKLDTLWSIEDFYIDNRLQMVGTLNKLDHQARHGDFKWFSDSGDLIQTGQYTNGVKDGKLVFFFTNGEIEVVENYSNGVFHGPFCSYYSNGQITTKGVYINGKLHGDVDYWYNNGQLKSHSAFNNGMETGLWTYYDIKGNVTNELLFQTEYEIIIDKLIFEIPNNEWYRDDLQKHQNIEWHSFKRRAIQNSKGTKIYPNISFLIEDVGALNDVILYSTQKRQKMSFNVDDVFTYQDSDLKLKNAIGYLGNTTYETGSKHTVLIVHALVDKKGIQIVMDMTSDIFEDFGNEFMEALEGISLIEQTP